MSSRPGRHNKCTVVIGVPVRNGKDYVCPFSQTTEYSYLDDEHDFRLQTIHHKNPSAATLSKFDYTYDAVGNIMTWRQQRTGSAAKIYTFTHAVETDAIQMRVIRILVLLTAAGSELEDAHLVMEAFDAGRDELTFGDAVLQPRRWRTLYEKCKL